MSRDLLRKQFSAKSSRDAELTEEDSVDLFFSFDITTQAFFTEQQESGASEFTLTRLPHPGLVTADSPGVLGLVCLQFRDAVAKPVNYAYLILLCLATFVLTQSPPVQEFAREHITTMIPPELTVVKPRAPKPKVEPKVEKKPVPEKKPAPQAEPEKVTEVTPEPEPVKPRMPVQITRSVGPPADALEKIATPKPRDIPDSRIEVSTAKRSTRETPAIAVDTPTARKPEMPPTMQINTAPAVREDVVPDSAPASVLTRKDIPTSVPEEERALPKNQGTIAPRRDLSSDRLQTPVAPEPNRTLKTESRLETVIQKREMHTLPVETPIREAGPVVTPGESRGVAPEDQIQGSWQRMESVGPLAHLNALCYGRKSDEFVYHDNFRLRCENNQIIEAWRRKD